MARSKSTSGSKATTKTEQTGVAGVPNVRDDGQAVAAETAPTQVKPEVKAEARAKADITAEPRKKLEVVKTTEPRRVLPINLEDEIRRRAYELYKQRGIATGSAAEDWLVAEREVRQRYRQQQSA